MEHLEREEYLLRCQKFERDYEEKSYGTQIVIACSKDKNMYASVQQTAMNVSDNPPLSVAM